jgi:hypothetical protein
MNNKETREARFKRVADKRTNDILEKIRILSNCANKSIYNYEKKDIDKIFNAIQFSVKEARGKFHISKNKKFEL